MERQGKGGREKGGGRLRLLARIRAGAHGGDVSLVI